MAKFYDIKGNELPKYKPNFSILSGKYGMHIGDSYTKAMANGTNGESTSGAFYNLDVTKLGMKGCLGYGVVSSTVKDRNNATSNGYAYYPMVCRVCHLGSEDTSGQTLTGGTDFQIPLDRNDIGYITFMGGTNDSHGYESSVGEDIANGKQNNIYGAMNLILQKLVESYPNVPIIVILQPCCANQTITEIAEGTDISKLSQSMKSVLISQRKQKAIKEVTEIYEKAYDNVHLVDCCFDWYSPLNATELSKIWSSDLLHLTGVGYTEIANKVYEKLEEIFSN